jgi:ABC-2 type transport system ATP-binding protein
MSEFEKQYQAILDYLHFEDFPLVTKRIIDLTLDTEDVEFYTKTLTFLDLLDTKPNVDVLKIQFTSILTGLYENLKHKPAHLKELLISCDEISKSYSSNGFAISTNGFAISNDDFAISNDNSIK